MTRYIGLSGYARAGKDSVANILGVRGWKRFAFADKLKEAVAKLDPILGIDAEVSLRNIKLSDALFIYTPDEIKEKFPEYRRLLQVMGTEVGRQMFGDNIWVDIALKQVQDNDLAVFTDCRFPNEADAIRALGGEVWRVTRPGYGPINGHASETSLDGYDFDYEVNNRSDLNWLAREVNQGLQTIGVVT